MAAIGVTDFTLPANLEAAEPPEARGLNAMRCGCSCPTSRRIRSNMRASVISLGGSRRATFWS
jgi:hypothetical protein